MQAVHSVPEPSGYGPVLRSEWRLGRMAGSSPVMQQLFSQMRHIARHLRTATLEGESGAGKMLAAQTLHEFSATPQSPFLPCPASQICESEAGLTLVRASSKADFARLPSIRRAATGTLVLTRIEELNSAQQARVLDLLQWIDVQHLQRSLDAIPHRVLCLSSQPVRKLASTAMLRADLAYRLTAIRFRLPPLRDRREDIPLLADMFLQRFAEANNKPMRGIDPEALPRLIRYDWPGNVRELESVISSAAFICRGQWVRTIDLPPLNAEPPAPPAPHGPDVEDDPNLDRAILRHIRRVLARVDGNKLRAAKMLGISRSTLYRLLESNETQNLG